jgi:hypothetical protein
MFGDTPLSVLSAPSTQSVLMLTLRQTYVVAIIATLRHLKYRYVSSRMEWEEVVKLLVGYCPNKHLIVSVLNKPHIHIGLMIY